MPFGLQSVNIISDGEATSILLSILSVSVCLNVFLGTGLPELDMKVRGFGLHLYRDLFDIACFRVLPGGNSFRHASIVPKHFPISVKLH